MNKFLRYYTLNTDDGPKLYTIDSVTPYLFKKFDSHVYFLFIRSNLLTTDKFCLSKLPTFLSPSFAFKIFIFNSPSVATRKIGEKKSSWCQSFPLERRDFDVYLAKQLTRLAFFIRHPVERSHSRGISLIDEVRWRSRELTWKNASPTRNHSIEFNAHVCAPFTVHASFRNSRERGESP